MTTKDRSSFDLTTTRLQEKLDHGFQKLAAQKTSNMQFRALGKVHPILSNVLRCFSVPTVRKI